MVNGILYLSAPNHVYAVDARTGRPLWHYVWRGRSAIGNRGVGMFGDWLFVVTPDNTVVSLDAATGKERWTRKLTATTSSNWSTSAPIVIRNHVLVGIGGDTPVGSTRGFLESLDPKTGASQWKWWTTPGPGEPGIETWPNPEASLKSSGAPWQPPTYDPELNLLYVPTGQATPTYNGKSREGANLYTCSIVALNADTGKMAWYYQMSPHDTHDWDATEVTILVDGTIDGQPRKLLAQTNRNGYFFLLDRTNGKSLVVKPFALSNSYLGVRQRRARAESGEGGRRRAARSCFRRRTARSIFRRSRSAPTPGCSTRTRPTPAASSTFSPIRPIRPASGAGRSGTAGSSSRG